MYSANAYVVRPVKVEDVPELVRLGWATQEEWPQGRILVGEIDGVVAAALAIDEGRALTAAVPGAPRLLSHMRARAAGMTAHARTASLADRIRERLRPDITIDV
jgi:hypothetical protein